jgi:hypothetical protein
VEQTEQVYAIAAAALREVAAYREYQHVEVCNACDTDLKYGAHLDDCPRIALDAKLTELFEEQE